MTRLKDKSNRTGWIMVVTIVAVMGTILGYGFYIEEFQLTPAENVALNLHIEDTDCHNVALAMVANFESERSKIVRTELERVWEEGLCGRSVVPHPDPLMYP